MKPELYVSLEPSKILLSQLKKVKTLYDDLRGNHQSEATTFLEQKISNIIEETEKKISAFK